MPSHHDPYHGDKALEGLSLGQKSEYKDQYDASLLQGVPRALNRDALGLTTLPFDGADIWTGYELSWLNARGKPMVAIAEFTLPAQSTHLVESKSFKLYLNTFNQTRFDNVEAVRTTLARDLSACAGGDVEVTLVLPREFRHQPLAELEGELIDELDIEVDDYQFRPEHLETAVDCEGPVVTETLRSDLLKSNCLITSQPDWGSVQIRYRGPQIDHECLLRYLISFRRHNEFHEQCVERIFMDLKGYCHCEQLTVYARYTRRGGLDINPFRSDFEALPDNVRLARQ